MKNLTKKQLTPKRYYKKMSKLKDATLIKEVIKLINESDAEIAKRVNSSRTMVGLLRKHGDTKRTSESMFQSFKKAFPVEYEEANKIVNPPDQISKRVRPIDGRAHKEIVDEIIKLVKGTRKQPGEKEEEKISRILGFSHTTYYRIAGRDTNNIQIKTIESIAEGNPDFRKKVNKILERYADEGSVQDYIQKLNDKIDKIRHNSQEEKNQFALNYLYKILLEAVEKNNPLTESIKSYIAEIENNKTKD